ncbi:MAG: hypothetical protein WC763_03395 [Candidatus Paceibacterota bacterium]|jgi:hypothetical protein
MHKAFTIGQSLAFGWAEYRKNIYFLTLVTAALFLIQIVIGGKTSSVTVAVTRQIFDIILGGFATFTSVRIGLRALKGQSFSWKDMFDVRWNVFGMYLIGMALFTLCYLVGFVFFFIPGLIAIIRLNFFAFILVDEGLSPLDALKKSFAITKGHFWRLAGFALVLDLIIMAGVLALGIGALVAIPVCLLSTAFVYGRLKHAASSHAHSHPQPTLSHSHAHTPAA